MSEDQVASFNSLVAGKADHGFVPRLISIAREKGVSALINDGLNR